LFWRFFFSAFGKFSPVSAPYWMQKKSVKICMSLAAFGKIFWITGGFWGTIVRADGSNLKAGINHLKRVFNKALQN
jgi:hypothetical protein